MLFSKTFGRLAYDGLKEILINKLMTKGLGYYCDITLGYSQDYDVSEKTAGERPLYQNCIQTDKLIIVMSKWNCVINRLFVMSQS